MCVAQARLKNPHNAELWLAAVRVEQRAGNIKAAESLMARCSSIVCSCVWYM